MAYVNVAEWGPEQVAEWLRGFDDVIHPYIHLFIENNVNGKRLLHLCSSDLLALNIKCIGHQEIILQGVQLLVNIHYHLHQENIQSLALHISSKSRSIYNDLRVSSEVQWHKTNSAWDSPEDRAKHAEEAEKSSHKNERVSTKILAGVVDALSSVKSLVSWLHKPPFNGTEEYDDLKSLLVELSIALATIAQRDAFAEKQSSVIKDSCLRLAEIADKIIQESKDPMVLQPATLEIATVRKRPEETLGISLASTYEGVHQIALLRTLSPAHNCGKLMSGDQIVQVNYQTVVGWTSMNVTQAMQENQNEVTLTLKKCPRNIDNYTSKIYFKPIRLPSKKRVYSPWESLNGMPTHRFDLQGIPALSNMSFMKALEEVPNEAHCSRTKTLTKPIPPPMANAPATSVQSLNSTGSDITGITRSDQDESEFSDDAFMSDSDIGAPSSFSVRLFQPKPGSSVQRRATVPGGTARPSISFDHILKEYCKEKRGSHDRSMDFDGCSKPHIQLSDHQVYNADEREKRLEMNSKSKSLEQTDMPYIDESDAKDLDNRDSRSDTVVSDGKESQYSRARENSPSPRNLSAEHPRLDKTTSSPIYSDELSLVNRSLESDTSSQFHSDSKPFNISSQTDSSLDNSKLLKSPPDSDRGSLRGSGLSDGSHLSRESNAMSEPPSDSSSFGVMDGSFAAISAQALRQEPQHRGNPSSQAVVEHPDSSHCYVNVDPRNKVKVTPHIVVNPLELARENLSGAVDRTNDFFSTADRRISCRDLGQGDQQGWLYQRRDGKGFLSSHRWVKRWFILMKNTLYGYRNKDALSASSLVYLPGFHVAPAGDVKSKRYAFKIFHASGATFYFSCDSAEERSRWMSQMGLSAISTMSRQISGSSLNDPYFSETDEEFEEKGPHKSAFAIGKDVSTPKNTPTLLTSQPSKVSGLKFLQPPKKALGQPVPTPNFRSYVRVRDNQSSETGRPPRTPQSSDAKENWLGTKEVKRKNSFRERLRQIPASLTMDRKKSKPVDISSPKRICTSSKSETSLVENQILKPGVTHSQSNVHLQTLQTFYTVEHTPKLNGREESPVYARRKSFEALRTQISSAPGSRQGICSLDDASSGEESVEENWQNSLRSVPTKSRLPPKSIVRDMTNSASEPQLKKAQQYFPVNLGRDRKEPMQTAFELSLSSSEQSLTIPRSAPERKTSVNAKDFDTPRKPQVPPRTKFFSPKELELPQEQRFSDTNTEGNCHSTPKSSKGSVPPNLVISPSTDDGESPRTPQMPAMGISMIGKPRRTPNALSPREILPHYPGMEYPPTFEPESYSLNFLPERPSPPDTRKKSPPAPRPSSSNSFGSSSSSGSYMNVGLVPNTLEESHNRSYHHQIYVTSPLNSESLSRSRLSNRSLGSQDYYQPVPPSAKTPNHSNSMSSFRTSPTDRVTGHSSSYLSMSAQPTSEYINMNLPKRSASDAKSARK